jgi:uncharacterized membrane protein
MQHWGPSLVLLSLIVLLLILGVISYLVVVYMVAGVLWYYLGVFLLILLMFAVPFLWLRQSHDFHVHHYNIGMVIVVLVGY